MKKRLLYISAAVCLVTDLLFAHEIPIRPVDIELKVYPTHIQMRLDSNQCYWSAVVLNADLPPPSWTPEFKDLIKKYVDLHFKLTLDGKPLESRLEDERYTEEPWQDHLSGRVTFKFSYALPPQGGRMLMGRSTFFSEYAAQDKDESYETRLDIPGRVRQKFLLPLQAPTFEVPFEEALRAPWQSKIDNLWNRFSGKLINLVTTVLAFVIVYIVVRYRSRF